MRAIEGDGLPAGNLLQSIKDALANAARILVISHLRPDGDAIGSLLGLGLGLEAAGKQVQMVSVDGVPSSLRHLPGSEQIVKKPQGAFDLICVVDCSDLERVGDVLNSYGTPDINIDHHRTNLNFGRLNLVDTQAVATAQIIAYLLVAFGYNIKRPVSDALLTGLITDTIGFRTSNMTPEAMRLAADLMETGTNLPELYQRALVSRTFDAARLWGAGLSKLQRENGLVWTTLTLDDRKKTQYSGLDDADLVNILSAIEEADIALIFLEQPDGRVKVSWRAQAGLDVSQVALDFGGGGHAAASGADIAGSLDEVIAVVLQSTRPLLNGYLAGNGN